MEVITEVESGTPSRSTFEKTVEKHNTNDSDSSDYENVKSVKRIQRLSDSDSESNSNKENLKLPSLRANTSSSDSEGDNLDSSSIRQRTRIRNISSDSEDENLKVSSPETNLNTVSRIQSKKNKLSGKFKNLTKNNVERNPDRKSDGSSRSSDESDDIHSIDKIKQKIQERNNYLKSTLYDPDTSDEESNQHQQTETSTRKKSAKSTKLISPKPLKMTPKQAMENMQKIKSESNRMLREREVSLPYHRPKALSLKDIMSKRRSAVTSDGKVLPIKMNGEQLKQYVKMLEERQKEVIQLCKSDTEEEDENIENEKEDINSDKDENTGETKNNKSNVSNGENHETDIKPQNVISDDLYDKLMTSNEREAPNSNQTEEYKSNEEIETQLQTVKILETDSTDNPNIADDTLKIGTESDSLLMVLQYSEKQDVLTEAENIVKVSEFNDISSEMTAENKEVNTSNDQEQGVTKTIHDKESSEVKSNEFDVNAFSDDEINMEDIDALIENAELIKDSQHKEVSLVHDTLKIKPKLTGAPGSVIDLDDSPPKNLSGVELLKERYIFFAKLKTPEELERDKEKRVKPGTLHLKLKHELEEKMAEQRSLEWTKRLEEEKAQQMEVDAVLGEDEEDIEKLEAKLDEEVKSDVEEEEESEEELEENDYNMDDKPRKRNPMVDDEAEVSDDEENAPVEQNDEDNDENGGHADNESDDSSDESSESEDETEQTKPKKGRILKAFEDSDEEDSTKEQQVDKVEDRKEEFNYKEGENITSTNIEINSQDDEIQLAQVQRTYSADIFASQSSGKVTNPEKDDHLRSSVSESQDDDKALGTQSFSIMDSTKTDGAIDDNFSLTCGSQSQIIEPEVVDLLDNLPQNLEQSQQPITQTQGFGEDVLALCTGNFYDNKFVSQVDADKENADKDTSQETVSTDIAVTNTLEPNKVVEPNTVVEPKSKVENCDVLKSILDELDSPEFDKPKPNKFFVGNTQDNYENKVDESQVKKRFVIDSDDETSENAESKKIKKKKKKRMEKRALQISDDEDDENLKNDEEYESELDDDDPDKVVEYDSEENEVITAPAPKKKKLDFFEDEAELSSNEEWSGDEDERGLDAMEREDGDQDVFHQGRLQRDLANIHMRVVHDQDKREVRMIQEMLLEDADLGDGHRRRQFRWKNMLGEDIDFSELPEFVQSQDEDFESEEQWQRERLEREMFLKKMRQNAQKDDISEIPALDEGVKVNITAAPNASALNDTEIVKNNTKETTNPGIGPLGILQGNFRGSLLSRGGSSLCRLASLAPADSEPTNVVTASSRNFVFAALSQDDTKVTKRKAPNEGTPRLIKKLKYEQNILKNSLLDHLNP